MIDKITGRWKMKNIAIIVVTILAFAGGAIGQKTAPKKVDPTKGVREAFDKLVEGIKQVDVDKVMSAYEKSDRLLIFNNNGTATIGWDNVNSNVKASYAKASNVSLDITGLRIEMLGKTNAYLTCKWVQRQDYDGKPENASGRMTLIYKLVGKDWKIIHRHTSPDNPDPTRPVLSSERTNTPAQ